MKTMDDYEKKLKEHAFKSHDLALEPDVVSIETALSLIEEAASQAIDRCSESAKTRTNDESTSIVVDKQSILDVKDELK